VTVGTLCKIFIRSCDAMNEAQPEAIHELYEIMSKFDEKKKTS